MGARSWQEEGWRSPALVGRPIAADRRLLADAAEEIVDVFDADHMRRQVQRMEASIDGDSDLAIGTVEESVQSIAKAILQARLVEFDPSSTSIRLSRRWPRKCV